MRRVYQLCLRSYPPAFRARHGAEMRHFVEEEWRAVRQRGRREMLIFSMRILGDLLRTAWHERLYALRRQDWLAFGTAAGCGITAGTIDFAGKETAATLLVCLVGGAYFSFFSDRRTWRWPLGLAVWLGLADFVVERLGLGGATRGIGAAGLAMVPAGWLVASVGVFFGAGGRRLLGPLKCGWTAEEPEIAEPPRCAE